MKPILLSIVLVTIALISSACGLADGTGFWGKLSGKSCGQNSAGLCSCQDDEAREINACLCDSAEGGCLCSEASGCGCASSTAGCACSGEDCLCNEARCVARTPTTAVHASELTLPGDAGVVRPVAGVGARCDATSCTCEDEKCQVSANALAREGLDAFACFSRTQQCAAVGTVESTSCDDDGCHCAPGSDCEATSITP